MTAAQQFAQWLQDTHPEVYEALYAHAMSGQASLRGFGDDTASLGLDFNPEPDTSLVQDIPVDQNNLDYVTASAYGDAVDALPGDLSVGISNPTMSSTQGVPGSTNSVSNWLTSSQGLTAITQLGTAVLGTVATAQVAKTQMAVIQAQAQRAVQGQSPVPVSYVTNARGQQIPVYVTGTGQVPPALTAAIGSGSAHPVTLLDGSTGYALSKPALTSIFGGSNLVWVLLLGAGLLLAVAAG